MANVKAKPSAKPNYPLSQVGFKVSGVSNQLQGTLPDGIKPQSIQNLSKRKLNVPLKYS